MKILFLAPMPVYQERGSPIAVKLLLEVLSQRGCEVDALVFHEGEDFQLKDLTLYRTPALPFVRNIRPGFSLKKLVCDVFLFFIALRLILTRRYQFIYAVEESAFMALIFKAIFRIPYIYDMDSSLAQQMVEKYVFLRLAAPVLSFFEGLAVNHAAAVVPVCDALADVSAQYHPQKTVVLYDVPQLDKGGKTTENLRQQLGITGVLAMYVGNLETYQGLDLLLASFALAQTRINNLSLVVIGGAPEHIERYQQQTTALNLQPQVHFIGPRPVDQLSAYLEQADILVSPRIKGINTPMKVYSYLASGKPVLATDLRTHTQILDRQVAVLAAPEAPAFAEALVQLASDAPLRQQLGANGQRLIAEKHNYAAFLAAVNGLLDWMTGSLPPRQEYEGQHV
ncbi:MAG TPA: glycosyltransferase family 4 protein [Phototrophicaceae bacterium]|nr:glycosyltransferase family 4 protein [Phototrophicaceae bacterium]